VEGARSFGMLRMRFSSTCELALFLRKEGVHQNCPEGSAVLVKSFARVLVLDKAYDAPEP
jgi:hypothetical protein